MRPLWPDGHIPDVSNAPGTLHQALLGWPCATPHSCEALTAAAQGSRRTRPAQTAPTAGVAQAALRPPRTPAWRQLRLVQVCHNWLGRGACFMARCVLTDDRQTSAPSQQHRCLDVRAAPPPMHRPRYCATCPRGPCWAARQPSVGMGCRLLRPAGSPCHRRLCAALGGLTMSTVGYRAVCRQAACWAACRDEGAGGARQEAEVSLHRAATGHKCACKTVHSSKASCCAVPSAVHRSV
jgi:hypothetical protein